ncbi:signal peptide peptidase SppA [Luteimonas sp. BDR2-5]|uniref:signal peptide peptidase SppA n=1 Tax=Proluteimonas luteida TaxID=2878685 RepID=UPI001E3F203C|nr:signal peptide peptidase SppA [Luteimonas sp. BDR2-5]MCD9027338.1 signal peptide peptidase SppA [Luteimonas sp. BDR2-5]
MSTVQPRAPLARFFVGLWDGMNFIRRLVLNLLFFGLLFLFALIVLLALVGRGSKPAPLLERSTLVIAPEGALVEQYRSDPFMRALAESSGSGVGEVQLRDLLRALDAAKDDKRIERVLLRTDRLTFSGYASMREVAEAIAAVRAAGKQVVAFGEYFGQQQYLLAAQADEVYLDPEGGMLLEGLSGYRQYYREALADKLQVDMHLFKVGEYKSAAEPFILDAASPEAKEADLYWMNDIWQRHIADIAAVRGLDPATINADIAALPAGIAAARGDLAQYALDRKLVDGLKTREEVEALLTERGVADEDADGGFRQISMREFLAHVDPKTGPADRRDTVAVVVAEGGITGGQQPPGTIGGESTSALLREAREDKHVKSVVLRVDSGGGEVFASEQIRREVDALKAAGKPVVVSMGDVAASGGYWISMNADRIYADASTITGSIGIFALVPTFPRTLEKFGIRTDGVGTTRFAGAFDLSRELDPEVGQVIQSVIDRGYQNFIGKVGDARGRSAEQIDGVARGRVWSGTQALERGLVDELGGLQASIAKAAELAGLEPDGRWRVRYVEKAATPFGRFLTSFVGGRAGSALLGDSAFAHGVLARVAPRAEQDLRLLEGVMTPTPGKPAKAIAYCFCEL